MFLVVLWVVFLVIVNCNWEDKWKTPWQAQVGPFAEQVHLEPSGSFCERFLKRCPMLCQFLPRCKKSCPNREKQTRIQWNNVILFERNPFTCHRLKNGAQRDALLLSISPDFAVDLPVLRQPCHPFRFRLYWQSYYRRTATASADKERHTGQAQDAAFETGHRDRTDQREGPCGDATFQCPGFNDVRQPGGLGHSCPFRRIRTNSFGQQW